ncbi:MAG: hypothetical protein J2P27_00195 [Actinobacteria bacterium]|nr:hypothetical protein [Actinomycetota bacterium]
MELAVIDHLQDMSPGEFNALDSVAGAAGCFERLQQREADGRWRVGYVRGTDDGVLRAAVPFYECRGRTWPDGAYDPSRWELPDTRRQEYAHGAAVLVGGCCDRRSGLPIDPDYRERRKVRALLVAVARVAAAHDRALAFPYAFPCARRVLAQAAKDQIVWATLGREAQFRDVVARDWEDRQPSRIRYVLRRDRRLMAAEGVRDEVSAWPEVEDAACELIAAHNLRKGQPDHPEFVRLRHREWGECQGVELTAFTAAADGVRGVLTALVWNSELELYEIGVDGTEGPARLAVYLSLIVHAPLRFAQARGLRHMRAGLAAETPKASRGAVFSELYGGVLDAANTSALAADEL